MAMFTNPGELISIRGYWVPNPDTETWSPVNEPTWTTNSGRVVSGLAVGSRQYFKYKIPLKWTNLPEQDVKSLQELIENGPDFFTATIYHKCSYISLTVYAGTFTPGGIYRLNGEVFYKQVTVNLIER